MFSACFSNIFKAMKRGLFCRRYMILTVVLCFMFGKLFMLTLVSEVMSFNLYVPEYLRNIYNVYEECKFSMTKRTQRRLVAEVSCAAILEGDNNEIQKAKILIREGKYARKSVKDKEYIQLTKTCGTFKSLRGYTNYCPSKEESRFSIAYSILLYKEVEQAERLLRAIYTPTNYYCLHADADSRKEVHDAIQCIANCFENVFVVSRKEYIVYAGFTRLQAELNCMEDLLQRGNDWKYYINVPSQEFPLKTNKEIVKILKIYNGANDIEGLTGKRRLIHRYKDRYVYRHVNNAVKPKAIKTNQTKEKPPYNVTIVKGSVYGVFSRNFVYFVIYNKIARELLDWFRDVLSPDEYYWATLNFNQHIGTPGSYFIGKPDRKPWLVVFAAWAGENQCNGKYVRDVCVFGVGDLKTITSKHHLFANKFYSHYQPYAFDCMEEWYLNRTTDETTKTLNISFYKSLPFIKRIKENAHSLQTDNERDVTIDTDIK